MEKTWSGVLAGIVAAVLAAAPAAAAPATVTVRVEGQAETVLPRTAVATTGDPVLVEGADACSGTSAGGALHRAVAGDLGGTWGPYGFQLKRVRGETQDSPPLSDPARYWSFWLNYRFQDQGVCATELQEGDDVLVFADCFSQTGACESQTPLRLTGVPATVAPGQGFTVRLEEFTTRWNGVGTETIAEPAEGATVVAGGAPVTTGADGTAQLSLSTAGAVTIAAAKPGRVRTAGITCVTSGADGSCGSPLPAGSVLGTERAKDTTAPVPSLTGLRSGQVFQRKRAPRALRGAVSPDPSGLRSVRLSILRRVGDRCWAFKGETERFKRHRCGGSRSFRIGDRADWSYLLPERLPRGRYTIRVVAIDNAGNDSATRVRIRVK